MSPPGNGLPNLRTAAALEAGGVHADTAAILERLRTMLSPQRFSLREEQFFLLLAVLIGIASGLSVVCFRICIDFLHLKLLGSGLQPSVPARFPGSDADRTGDCVPGY